MLWINYLDTGGERVHTSLEGSFRMEGWRGGGDEKETAGFKERFTCIHLSSSPHVNILHVDQDGERREQSRIKVMFTLVFPSLFVLGKLTEQVFSSDTLLHIYTSCTVQPQTSAGVH